MFPFYLGCIEGLLGVLHLSMFCLHVSHMDAFDATLDKGNFVPK